MTSLAITGEVVESPALVRGDECRWVRETATGLQFREDTPIEVWGELVTRLTCQEKRIQWLLGDAIRFGEQAYEDHKYAQWIEQTGLAENTLSTMRWVAERIDPLRRRKDVGWSHHREVAPLPPERQDALLEMASERGMTRWEVRQAVKVEEEKSRGKAATAEGAPIEEPDNAPALPLSVADLTDEAKQALDYRAAGVGKRHRQGFEAGFVAGLVWGGVDAFKEWRP